MKSHWHRVLIYEPARTEILRWPLEVRKDFGAILTKLQKGDKVGYPDTKPMSTVASGVFEIRLKDAGAAYRAFYVIETEYGILVFHTFKKKSQKTPAYEIETAAKRLKVYLKELSNEA